MMGMKERSFASLTALSLEDLVPADHFYRHLERTLDLEAYAGIGRPSVDPVVFFRLQLVMCFEGLRSERQLMRVVADRLSLRWYLGYDLTEPLPDHSSLTRIRDRYGLAVFRRFFDAIVERCIEAGLVWGKELYVDATKVEANASPDSLAPRFAVEAHLADLFAGSGEASGDDVAVDEEGTNNIPALPVELSDEARAELAGLAAARHDWIGTAGRPNRAVVSGSYRRIADYRASATDPDASPMRLTDGRSRLGYQDHSVVDGGKARIVLAALVTPAEVQENQPMLDLLWRVRFRWKLHPRHVTGDTKYGTAENVVAIEDQRIRAYVPLPDLEARKPGIFGASAFAYDAEHDVFHCPGGRILGFRKHRYAERLRVYQAPAGACNACSLKPRCTHGNQGRQVSRHFDEACLSRVRGYQATGPYQKAMRKRQVWVEPLFAEAKAWHGLRRFRLRRLPKVNGEGLLVAAGQNLKRLLSKAGWGRRPWPSGAAGLVLPAHAPGPATLG
jgi:transposase